MGLFSFLRTHAALNNDQQQQYIALLLTDRDGPVVSLTNDPRVANAAEYGMSNDHIAENILAYMESKGWDAAECINRISHAHSLVFARVGNGATFKRSKEITNLVIAAIKHMQMMRDMAR
jgi:hypothetical protein